MAKYVAAIDARRFDVLGSLLSPQLVQHVSDMNLTTHGRTALVDRVRSAVLRMPDIRLSLALVVANGDVGVTKIDATYSRDGQKVHQFWLDMWRISDGKIVEHWQS